MSSENKYDVVICGGGLAGLTLARQLRRALPDCSILLLERMPGPLPEAAFKVGESSVAYGAHYFAGILGLRDYMKEKHLVKMELRYFFPTRKNFEDRPEIGVAQFPPVDSYQIDRGIFERDLRMMNREDGVTLIEGASVNDIVLAPEKEGCHEVRYKDGNAEEHKVQCRWVIDAMGRRRFLQKKLGLMRRHSELKFSAVWFRLRGRIDVSDLVSAENQAWQERVPGRNRYYSTTHLMGNGYWVWLIPLSSGNTSIGIVIDERFHPFSGLNNHDSAMAWMQKWEPTLAAHIKDHPPLDFLRLRDYSYSSRQVLSHARWACVGEAGVFADPFYSPGSDLIGFGNCIVTKLITDDTNDRLQEKTVDELNAFLLAFNDRVTSVIHAGYPYLGCAIVTASKLIWDLVVGWGITGPLMFNLYFLDPAVRRRVGNVTNRFTLLSRRMQHFFVEWAARTQRVDSFKFIDYLAVPFIRDLRLRNLKSGKSAEELVADQMSNIEIFEGLAQAIFLLAIEDLYPGDFKTFPVNRWLNVAGISLDKTAWERNGLFQPTTQPQKFGEVRHQFRNLFELQNSSLEPVDCPTPVCHP